MDWRALALAGALVLAGCGGASDRVVASGSPAAVEDAALEATGYERVSRTNRTLNTTLRATISGDVEMNAQRSVTATTPIATYRRATDAGPALFVVATAPAVRPIENQPVVRNPLVTEGTTHLVGYVQSTYAVESLERRSTRTVTVFGNETTARTSTGPATRDGAAVSLRVVVAAVRHDGEFVTAVAVGPRVTLDRDRVRRLLAGVTH